MGTRHLPRRRPTPQALLGRSGPAAGGCSRVADRPANGPGEPPRDVKAAMTATRFVAEWPFALRGDPWRKEPTTHHRARELGEIERTSATARLAGGDRPRPARPAARRAVVLPGLRPPPGRAPSAPGAWLERRGRQPLRRLQHGLRRPVRRALHPAVRRAIEAQLDDGTLFVTPVRAQRRGGRAAGRALRPADVALHQLGHRGDHGRHPRGQGVTGRDKIVKVEGGYHGHHDEVMISMKPPLVEAGPADAPGSSRRRPA